MFAARNYTIVLALTIWSVARADAQQPGGQQKGCLTPRDAFEVNEPGAKLCPPQSKATTSAANAAGGSSANPAPTNRGATKNPPVPNAGATAQTTGSTPRNEPAKAAEPRIFPEQSNPTVSEVNLNPLPPLVLKYYFLKNSSTGGWVPTKVATEFRTGDRIKLKIESSQEAYLYILAIGPTGQQTSLFPNEKIDGGRNLVPAHKTYEVPADPERGIVFEPPAGQEKLFVILSRTPLQDVDKKLRDSRESRSPTQIASNVDVGAIRTKARNLVLEDTSDLETYIANGNGATDDLVWADVTLNHK
jgi:hypothetical protein